MNTNGEDKTTPTTFDQVDKPLERLTVVLDMDGFLIHAYNVSAVSKVTGYHRSLLTAKPPAKKVIKELGAVGESYNKKRKETMKVKFVKRPALDHFLAELVEMDVNVIIWTSGEKKYADTVLNVILPEPLQGCRRFYRGSCDEIKLKSGATIHSKDLNKKFTEQQLARTILLDDSSHNFKRSPGNGILCLRWLGDLKNEPNTQDFLTLLLDVVYELTHAEDVRNVSQRLTKDLHDKVTQHSEVITKKKRSSALGSFFRSINQVKSTFSEAIFI